MSSGLTRNLLFFFQPQWQSFGFPKESTGKKPEPSVHWITGINYTPGFWSGCWVCWFGAQSDFETVQIPLQISCTIHRSRFYHFYFRWKCVVSFNITIECMIIHHYLLAIFEPPGWKMKSLSGVSQVSFTLYVTRAVFAASEIWYWFLLIFFKCFAVPIEHFEIVNIFSIILFAIRTRNYSWKGKVTRCSFTAGVNNSTFTLSSTMFFRSAV